MTNCATKALFLVSSGFSLKRSFSTSLRLEKDHYKLVVLGGGSGGAATGNKFGSKLGKENVALIEPRDKHFYQPGFTLVGGGVKKFEWTYKPMDTVIQNCTRIKDKVVEFKPSNNTITTEEGKEIEYDYLVVAVGLQQRYDLIKGLTEALENDDQVCTNYHFQYVNKTFPAIQNVKSGNAIFTFPDAPINCSGAPQKICYLADEYFRKHNVRDHINMYYTTALPAIYQVKWYAGPLAEVAARKNITVKTRTILSEVKSDKREAVFDIKDEQGKVTGQETLPYDMLHVGPPCSALEVMRNAPKDFVDAGGWVSISKQTLQHDNYPNVFAVGDCTNLPTAKTAAALASQFGIMQRNLKDVMAGKTPTKTYNGYTSCPLVTGYHSLILAEFDYDHNRVETFPVDQRKERRSMLYMKRDFMPIIYWHLFTRGLWYGPRLLRKIFHLGMV